MRLSDVPEGVRVYGGFYNGPCAIEAQEQVTFFNQIRQRHPETWGLLALHPRNEQLLRGGQHGAILKHKAEGMTPGASDIIIPGRVCFVCELKRRDPQKSKWQDGQKEYLNAAHAAGAFACVAFGWKAAWTAFEDWLSL